MGGIGNRYHLSDTIRAPRDVTFKVKNPTITSVALESYNPMVSSEIELVSSGFEFAINYSMA